MKKGPRDKATKPLAGSMHLTKATGPVIGHLHVEGDQVNQYSGSKPAAEFTDDELLQAFTTYLHAVADDCSKLVTRGIDLGGDAHQKPLRLAHVYVSLDTKSLRPSRRDERRASPETMSALSALEVLFDPQTLRVVLVGEPGSGKSTFLQYVTLCLADELCAAQGAVSHLAGLEVPDLVRRQRALPLRLLLRDFAPTLDPAKAGSSQHIEDFLHSQLVDRCHTEAAARLSELLKRGLAFVLFDGLDEVPGPLVSAVRQAIAGFAAGEYRRCRIAVTCRTESYKKAEFKLIDFPVAHEIEPLSSEFCARFVHAWYRELEEVQPQFRSEGAACAASLLNALATEQLRGMAGNPFFLTAMAALHRPDKPLPHTSAELMDRLVNSVLEESRKRGAGSEAKTGEPELAALLKPVKEGLKVLRLRLEAIAYAAREKRQDQASRFVDEDLLRARLLLARHVDAAWVERLLQTLLHRAGLLQSPDGRNFEFAYRFEEFLAGCHLANRDAWVKLQPSFVRRALDLLKKQGDYARQVVVWAAGVNAHVQIDRSSVRELVSALTPRDAVGDSASLRHLELAAEIARDAGMEHWEDEDVPDTNDTVNRLRTRLEAVRDGAERFEIDVRSRAASALGRLGDYRPGVGLRSDGLPDLDFTIELPTGKFALGETGKKVEIERSFRLARYPVTVAQFQAFVAAGGYEDDGSIQCRQQLLPWWGRDGLQWKRAQGLAGPEDYDPVFQTPNHPRVGVSWYEAMAFCRWLTDQLHTKAQLAKDQNVTLPTETQWEWAARWCRKIGRADGRYFPWGGSKDDAGLAERCNMWKTGIRSTSAIGLFVNGQAECGAMDLSGNVWEWCENWSDAKAKQYRVLRGGSWFNDIPEFLTCWYGYGGVSPGVRDRIFGFRCVMVLGASAPE
jgi:formylglycine-generating enzyme required for sulfatase activity